MQILGLDKELGMAGGPGWLISLISLDAAIIENDWTGGRNIRRRGKSVFGQVNSRQGKQPDPLPPRAPLPLPTKKLSKKYQADVNVIVIEFIF